VGVAMSRDPNGDNDEPLLDGVADFVASHPTDSHVTDWVCFRASFDAYTV